MTTADNNASAAIAQHGNWSPKGTHVHHYTRTEEAEELEWFEARGWFDDSDGWVVEVLGTSDRKKVFHGPDAQEEIHFPGPSAGHRLIELGYMPDRNAMYGKVPGLSHGEVRAAGVCAGWLKTGPNMWTIPCYRRG